MRVDTHEEKNVAVHMTVDELHKMLVKALTQRGTNLPRAEDFKTLELERRPTVDRAWVVCAMSDETMTDMEVVEGGEDREKVLASMVKKHGGAK